MNASYDKNAAVVVLPPVAGGRLTHKGLRAWLARSELSRETEPQQTFVQLVHKLGFDVPEQGLAALRMWGQTGDRPGHWMAAADPIYLEPQMDSLCLHASKHLDVAAQELRGIVDHLQTTLGDDGALGFTRLGSCGYVSSKTPFATSSVPDCVADQREPGQFLPTNGDTALHRKVLGEIELALHEHPVNLQRESEGRQPVNSLWLWGGGIAPPAEARSLPPLYSDDGLLTGYWHSNKGVTNPWTDAIGHCLDESVAGFVAESPDDVDEPALLEKLLLELRDALRARRLSALTLLFRCGLRAEVLPGHARRFWRRDSTLLDR